MFWNREDIQLPELTIFWRMPFIVFIQAQVLCTEPKMESFLPKKTQLCLWKFLFYFWGWRQVGLTKNTESNSIFCWSSFLHKGCAEQLMHLLIYQLCKQPVNKIQTHKTFLWTQKVCSFLFSPIDDQLSLTLHHPKLLFTSVAKGWTIVMQISVLHWMYAGWKNVGLNMRIYLASKKAADLPPRQEEVRTSLQDELS